MEEAQEKYLSAYLTARQVNYDRGLMIALPKLAERELAINNSAGALRYLLEESTLLVSFPNNPRNKAVVTQIGDIYYAERLFLEALPYYKTANHQIALKDKAEKVLFCKR